MRALHLLFSGHGVEGGGDFLDEAVKLLEKACSVKEGWGWGVNFGCVCISCVYMCLATGLFNQNCGLYKPTLTEVCLYFVHKYVSIYGCVYYFFAPNHDA